MGLGPLGGADAAHEVRVQIDDVRITLRQSGDGLSQHALAQAGVHFSCIYDLRHLSAHPFGPFASRRCYDQAFLSGGYAKNDITIIGTDPGVTATMNGGTHMPFEDVALYRALPGSTVIDVAPRYGRR